eukprot:comp22041_c3_seq1/m.32012 comp22041_c3_seq1/g.32012  ORF comp22041_c3_seq1/g.32012 comp22041_c3_seq1/m.32012 type:complete len:499 (-) comp22041_c3_seq1:163-1659(-)
MPPGFPLSQQTKPPKADGLIDLCRSLLLPSFILHHDAGTYAETFETLQLMIDDHRDWQNAGSPDQSKLSELTNNVGTFFTPLPLRQAFMAYDKTVHLSEREHIAPTPNDIRKILNVAQVQAVAKQVKLVTFDLEQALCREGQQFDASSNLADLLIRLLRVGIHVGIILSAGYVSNPTRYEERLGGLLNRFRRTSSGPDEITRFHVVGGQCNYLYDTSLDAYLMEVPAERCDTNTMLQWTPDIVDLLLTCAEKSLSDAVRRLELPVRVVRKERSVGAVRLSDKADIAKETFDEVAWRVKDAIDRAKIPVAFSVTSGGKDVWVDVGNKPLGIQMLENYTGSSPATTLHFGDLFAADATSCERITCCTAWVQSTSETDDLLGILLAAMAGRDVLAEELSTPQSGTITLLLECRHAGPRDCVVMVGGKAGLGAWSAFDAPVMQRTPGSPYLFSIAIQPQGGETIEYRFAKISAIDQSVTWMQGDNLKLKPVPHDATISYSWT